MKCNNCGFENNDNSKFCAKCGSQLEKSIRKKKSKKKLIGLLILFFLALASTTFGFFLWQRFERGEKYIAEVRLLMDQEQITQAYQKIETIPKKYQTSEILNMKMTLEKQGKDQCLIFCKKNDDGEIFYGLCDLLGEEVLPCIYSEIEPLDDRDQQIDNMK